MDRLGMDSNNREAGGRSPTSNLHLPTYLHEVKRYRRLKCTISQPSSKRAAHYHSLQDGDDQELADGDNAPPRRPRGATFGTVQRRHLEPSVSSPEQKPLPLTSAA